MKKIITGTLSLLIMMCIVACKKDNAVNNQGLVASKTSSVKKGEPVPFSFPSVPASSAVKWSVSPSIHTQVAANGNQAIIRFLEKGSFVVTATFNGAMASQSVSVTDSSYTEDTATGTILPITPDDVVKISVARIDSGSTSGLLFTAKTSNAYICANNSMTTETEFSTTSITLKYTGVNVPVGCNSGTAYPIGSSSIYPVSSGSNILNVVLNGITYSGTIVKTGNSYTINWPDTGKVMISPTSL